VKQKIIMENWRRFLEEEQHQVLTEEELEEGAVQKGLGGLGLMLAFANGTAHAGSNDYMVVKGDGGKLTQSQQNSLDTDIASAIHDITKGNTFTREQIKGFVKSKAETPEQAQGAWDNLVQSNPESTIELAKVLDSNVIQISYHPMDDGTKVDLAITTQDGKTYHQNGWIGYHGLDPSGGGYATNMEDIRGFVKQAFGESPGRKKMNPLAGKTLPKPPGA